MKAATFAAVLTTFAFAACDVGTPPGGDDDDDSPDAGNVNPADADPNTPSVALSLAPAAGSPCSNDGTIMCPGELGNTFDFTVTVDASGGFAGDVTLAATGLGTGWTAAFTPSVVTLAADGTGTATLSVVVASNGQDGNMNVGVAATSTAATANAASTFVIANTYTAVVSGTCDLPATPGGTIGDPIRLRVGTMFRMLNQTGGQIVIHSNDGSGQFPHQGGDVPSGTGMPVGDAYPVTPTAANTFEWYCHQPDMGQRAFVAFE